MTWIVLCVQKAVHYNTEAMVRLSGDAITFHWTPRRAQLCSAGNLAASVKRLV